MAELLAAKRREAGLTQVSLSMKLSRPQSYVADVERGQRRVDVVELLDIAKAIGFDPVDIVHQLKEAP